jgi:hypothetical protein
VSPAGDTSQGPKDFFCLVDGWGTGGWGDSVLLATVPQTVAAVLAPPIHPILLRAQRSTWWDISPHTSIQLHTEATHCSISGLFLENTGPFGNFDVFLVFNGPAPAHRDNKLVITDA